MLKNFSDFVNNEQKTIKVKDETFKSEEFKQEDLEKLIDMYSGFSEDKLLGEFVKMTIERKKKGNLDYNELSHIRSTIEPFLNTEQKENLKIKRF